MHRPSYRTLPRVRRWHKSIVLDKDTAYSYWLHAFFGRNRYMFQRDATRAATAEEYSDRTKAMMYMKKHLDVQRALFETFPALKPERRLEALYDHLHNGLNCSQTYFLDIRDIIPSRMLTNLACEPHFQRQKPAAGPLKALRDVSLYRNCLSAQQQLWVRTNTVPPPQVITLSRLIHDVSRAET